jgi:DNA polymerase-3 subunit beta
MKFTVNRVSFLKQLNTVNVAIGPKSPTPAFLNFKLEMNDDGLTVLGSDNEITIKNFLPVSKDDKTFIENYTEGSTLISAKYLLEIV